MRTQLLTTTALVLALAVPCFAMGGGGGGGGSSGGYDSVTAGGGSMSGDDYSVGVRLIRHKQYQDAIMHLELALADKPHDADILNYLGYAKRMVGDYDASYDFYQRALKEDPNHKGVHEYLGELYLQKNDPASAQKELQILASLCPSGCDERDTLTKAMADYKPPAGGPAAATTPTATPASATQ